MQNTATGYASLSSNTQGNYNSGYGSASLNNNNTGIWNTATGAYAMYKNTLGNYNTATGGSALYNNTGSNNTAGGYEALYSNTAGTQNTANGSEALYSNTTGADNTASGSGSLYNNTTGFNNTAAGEGALYSNTTGSSNTAAGQAALYFNTTGAYNTASGSGALSYNTTGGGNTATGEGALDHSTTGAENTASGISALLSNTTGSNNTANGGFALYYNTTGSGNTALGHFAGVINGDDSYGSAFGYDATCTASNQVRIGSIGYASDPTSIGGKVGWSTLSDGRVKKNIRENVPGLVFINKLKPVTYNIDNEAINKIIQLPAINDKDGKTIQPSPEKMVAVKAEEQVVHTGFIAQDVEKAAKDMNYEFSGVDAAKNDKDLYGLRYADFVVPLVKAVQELSKQNDSLQNTIADMKIDIAQLKAAIFSGSHSGSASTITTTSVTLSSAAILQNIPNPFTNNTTIQYSLPSGYTNASIVITDKAGKTLKTIALRGSYSGTLQIEASTLAAGAYQYALIVDGNLVDSKQMLRTK